ncbi:hypothetical protein AAMO2058_000067100 [Amorphochlora amoebiformis]
MAIPYRFYVPAIGTLCASFVLTTVALFGSWTVVAGNGRGLTYGIIGYTEKVHGQTSWTAYVASNGNSDASSPSGKLVTASSVQVCLHLFALVLNCITLWALFSVLPWCVRRSRTRSNRSVLCCCGCGRRVTQQPIPFVKSSPILAGFTCVVLVTSAITWPVLANQASVDLAAQKGIQASASLAYSHTLIIVAALTALAGSILAVFVCKHTEVETLSGHKIASGVQMTEKRSQETGGFDIERALASLESQEDEPKSSFASRKASTASSRISREAKKSKKTTTTRGAKVSKSISEQPRPAGTKSVGRWISRVTRALVAQPKYGRIQTSEADAEIDEQRPVQPRSRPADVLNPFASHTDHRVEHYLTGDIDASEESV